MLQDGIYRVIFEYRPKGEILELLQKAYELARNEHIAEMEQRALEAEQAAFQARKDKTLTFEEWKQVRREEAEAYNELMRKYEEEDCCETEDD